MNVHSVNRNEQVPLCKCLILLSSGFSTVDLVEDAYSHKTYAVKKIICHGEEDQKVAMKEVEYHGILRHPNIIECFDSALKDRPNPILNSTSEVMIVLPYYEVNF
jgi:serine/threonine kinase 16